LGEAGDLKPRANPANGIKDIHKYLEVSLAGKRFIININISPRRLAVVKRQERSPLGDLGVDGLLWSQHRSLWEDYIGCARYIEGRMNIRRLPARFLSTALGRRRDVKRLAARYLF
jgi:hypothetical protein